MAASATFALKAGPWVRRARFAIIAPDRRHSRRSQAEIPLIGLSEFARPPLWLVIQRRARDFQQPALRRDRQIGVVSVDQRATLAGVHGPDLFRKKSRSTVSWPIFSYKGAS